MGVIYIPCPPKCAKSVKKWGKFYGTTSESCRINSACKKVPLPLIYFSKYDYFLMQMTYMGPETI